MKKLLISAGVQLGSSALAIVLADILLSRFSLRLGGLIAAIVVFTAAQLLLERAIATWANRRMQALAGLASLASTLIALIMAALPFGGIQVSGFLTWVYAALVIWAVTGISEFLMQRYNAKSAIRQ